MELMLNVVSNFLNNVNRWKWRFHMSIDNDCRVEEAPHLKMKSSSLELSSNAMKAQLTSLPQIRGKLKFRAFLE